MFLFEIYFSIHYNFKKVFFSSFCCYEPISNSYHNTFFLFCFQSYWPPAGCLISLDPLSTRNDRRRRAIQWQLLWFYWPLLRHFFHFFLSAIFLYPTPNWQIKCQNSWRLLWVNPFEEMWTHLPDKQTSLFILFLFLFLLLFHFIFGFLSATTTASVCALSYL